MRPLKGMMSAHSVPHEPEGRTTDSNMSDENGAEMSEQPVELLKIVVNSRKAVYEAPSAALPELWTAIPDADGTVATIEMCKNMKSIEALLRFNRGSTVKQAHNR